MKTERSTGPINTALRRMRDGVSHERGGPRGCALFIGAGCSVSAGIPAAAGFVDEIRRLYPEKYEEVGEPRTYKKCMAALTQNERQYIVRTLVSAGRKLNPAHLILGQLMKDGWIDRILTTNFDSLVSQACNLVGVEPAIYDYTALAHEKFSPAKLADRAVIYLHGQHSGFLHLNKPEDFSTGYFERMASVFRATDSSRMWIVVGYSGHNDPTADELLHPSEFSNHLYWVGYQDEDPDATVIEKLGQHEGDVTLVQGFDADRFFASLASDLGCYPPAILKNPFSHLESRIGEFQLPAPWRGAFAGFEWQMETALQRALALVQSAGRHAQVQQQWNAEETLEVPTPHRGLILNLALYNKKGYDTPEELCSSYGAPDFRERALDSNRGPLIAAVEHHAPELLHCWMVCSPQVRRDYESAERLVRVLAPKAESHEVSIENPNSILDVQRRIEDICDSFAPRYGLKTEDLVADITSGNAIMTGGMVLAASDRQMEIEYLRQDERLVRQKAGGERWALTAQQIKDERMLVGIHKKPARASADGFDFGAEGR